MKKYLTLILITLAASQFSFSQSSTTTIGRLVDKDWIRIFPSEKQYMYTDSYNREIITTVFVYNNSEVKLFSKYYLSDTIDFTFNENNVGKVYDGKYLVKKNEKGDVSVFEILNLSNNTLKLKNIRNGSIIRYKANIK